MRGFSRKVAVLIALFLLVFSQGFSFLAVDDKEDLAVLTDGFAVAMSKKDKAWMDVNFTPECVTYVPNGQTLDRQTTIHAFTGGVYYITKASASNKAFMVAGIGAGGSADYTVEGTLSDGNDISGTYKLTFKFKKGGAGWKISEILIHGE